MATIASTITLHDNMTAVLNRQSSAANTLVDRFRAVDAATANFDLPAQWTVANGALGEMTGYLGRMVSLMQENNSLLCTMNDSFEQLRNRTRESADNAGGLLSALKKGAAALGGAKVIKEAFDLSDTLTSTTARLNMMNDGAQDTEALTDKIFRSAQRARGEYQATADAVSKLGTMAGDAFSSNDETIAFVEQINKQFTIAGTSSEGIRAAMLQLTQAMGSGVLRGEEFNSILEQAPNIIQTIAEYMGVPKGQLKDMAAEGLITADIVKNAMLDAAEITDAKFNAMPKTMEQTLISFKNQALVAIQPILEKINEMVNSENFQTAIDSVANSLVFVADIALSIMDVLGGAISFVSDNWGSFAPIILGVASALGVYKIAVLASSAATKIAHTIQNLFNGSLATSSHKTAIMVGGIMVLIGVIYSICQSIAKFTGIANSGFGVICGGVMVVIAFFKNLGLAVANVALGIWEAMCACGENIWAVFHNVFCDLQWLWYGFLKVVMDVVKGVCDVLNFIPFVNIDTSGLVAASQDFANKQAEAQNSKTAYKDVGEAFNKGASTFDAFSDGWVEDAFQSGAAWGDGVVDGINSMLDGFGSEVDTSALTGDMNVPAGTADDPIHTNVDNDINIADEDLQLMRDVAEARYVQNFVTLTPTVQVSGNTINEKVDVDYVVDEIENRLSNEIAASAEGVYG